MRALCYLLIITGVFITLDTNAQSRYLTGKVSDLEGDPIGYVNVAVLNTTYGAVTNEKGGFRLLLPSARNIEVRFSHVNYHSQSIQIFTDTLNEQPITIVLSQQDSLLKQVIVEGDKEKDIRQEAGLIKLDPIASKTLPTPFGDFSQYLATLPGVVSNNELSSSYAVRGGNFDENQVYVNDIQIYRPFMIRAGQQDGLSFVNADLVDNVEFSSGGWAPKYGDKLSSNLSITYKKPKEFGGSLTVGLLGGAFHLEGVTKNKKNSFLIGARNKRSEYLLNTLETKGEYLPRFTDIQSWLNFDLTTPSQKEQHKNSELGVLMSYAHNRYLVRPESRETTFGTFNQTLNLFVAFEGQEIMEYDIWQGGLKYTYFNGGKLRTDIIFSQLYTREREYFDIEGGYRLCDVDNRPGSETFNQCIAIRGIGTDYEHARNRLNALVLNTEIRSVYDLTINHVVEFGMGYSYQNFDDSQHEYSFIDSSDFVTLTETIYTDNNLTSGQITGYVQTNSSIGNRHFFTYGARFNYYEINRQFLLSPRIQYAFKPNWIRDVMFRGSAGWYQQPPFYREMRNLSGMLNTNLLAQSSIHFIGGIDYDFSFGGRGFKLLCEGYYKYLYNVVPYDIENVRIRYYGENMAKAYAAGIDFRVSGEFIPGEQSWFSLGILDTKEDIEGDDRGYIDRPSNQHVNFNIFFQDHIPNDPTYRVYLNLVFGSGFPFGPPDSPENRNVFKGSTYQRVDLGLSKVIHFSSQTKRKKNPLESLWLGIEILNVTGHDNTISYYWVRDFQGVSYAIPNSLTSRFLNGKVIVKF